MHILETGKYIGGLHEMVRETGQLHGHSRPVWQVAKENTSTKPINIMTSVWQTD